MTEYRHRAILIEAQQFIGGITDASRILTWINNNGGKAVWCGATSPHTNSDGRVKHPGLPETLRIRTTHGWEMINVGDYAVQDDQGEFFKCDPVSFALKYESSLADVVPITNQMHDWNNQRIRPHA